MNYAKYRRTGISTWSKVETPIWSRHREAMDWCDSYPSESMYYFAYISSHWQFENEEDAIIFALMGFSNER